MYEQRNSLQDFVESIAKRNPKVAMTVAQIVERHLSHLSPAEHSRLSHVMYLHDRQRDDVGILCDLFDHLKPDDQAKVRAGIMGKAS